MKNNNLFKLSLLAFSVLGIAGCSHAEPTKIEEELFVFKEEDVISQGMKIQRLISGADSNNHPYQTFSYETVPVNSPYSDIDVTTAFVNGTSCSDYVTTQHDAVNKTITLTCLQPFSTVINLHLEAHYKSSVYADVKVRYLPKYSTILRNYLELYEEDTQNSGQYVERTVTAAYEDSFEFTVSTNTEGVVSNPRQPATVGSSTLLFIDTNVNGSTSDPSYSSEDEFINNSLNLAQMLEICPEYYTGNNFSSSFLQLMQNTGFDVILPKIMMRSFIHQTSVSTTRKTFSLWFRSDLLNYLCSNRFDTDLRFDSTNTKDALINGIIDWISNNSVVYIPFVWLDLKSTGETSRVSGFDWDVNFANGEVKSHDDLTDGELPFYSSVKILMPSPYTVQELAPLSITVESSDIYF